MGRNQVTVSYERVEKKRPRKKHRWVDEIPMPSGLSPLARYVEENMAEGVTPQELVQQFQEYDCVHHLIELAVGPSIILDYCTHCGLIEKRKNRRK
jgi:hypothetical protein